MALDRFNENMDIIAGLGDDPKRDDGLSTPQFKSVFDKAGLLIQKFLNEKLIPQIENFLDEGTVLGKITEVLSGKLDKTGGTMEGPINMNGQSLSGLNAPTKDDEPATKGYVEETTKDFATETFVNDAVKTAAPRNLLDNSYFANPVNQRGVTSWTPSKPGYWSLDRWVTYGVGTTFTLKNKKVVISNDGSATCGFQQRIEEIALSAGKRYTLAVKGRVTGTWYLSFGENVGSNTGNKELDQNVDKVHVYCFTLPESTDGLYNFRIRASANVATAEIEWMAFYEGEYTAETLPEYQPKGYGAELAECMRYFYKNVIRRAALNAWNLVDSCFYYPIPMRLSNLTVVLIEPNTGWIGYASMWYDGTQYDNVEVSVVETSNTFAKINSPNGKLREGADIAVNVEVSADL